MVLQHYFEALVTAHLVWAGVGGVVDCVPAEARQPVQLGGVELRLRPLGQLVGGEHVAAGGPVHQV